jgi:transcriptional regulator with XRE-family HTH domain
VRQSLLPGALVWKTVLSGGTSSTGAASELGARVRELRRERGLTLKGLGRLAGLSHPFLSQVERGLARPSLISVQRIADALGVPVAELWAPRRAADPVRLMRRGEGDTVELAGARVREWTAANPGWPTDHEAQRGERLVYVARGAVEVELEGTVHRLGEGDALRFDGSLPHRLRRAGGPGTRALIVTSG